MRRQSRTDAESIHPGDVVQHRRLGIKGRATAVNSRKWVFISWDEGVVNGPEYVLAYELERLERTNDPIYARRIR